MRRAFFSNEVPRRFHGFLIDSENFIDGWMVLLDAPGDLFDVFARGQLFRQLGELLLGFFEQGFSESEQASVIMCQKMFFLEQQIIVFGAHGINRRGCAARDRF